jgi:hypothetical protein
MASFFWLMKSLTAAFDVIAIPSPCEYLESPGAFGEAAWTNSNTETV